MRARSLVTTALAAGVLAAANASLGASTAMPAAVSPIRCGTVRFDGKALPYYAQGVRCTAAKALLEKLSPLPHPGRPMHVYPGRYLGMLCVYSDQIDNKVGVTCNNASHTKMVSAGRRG